LNFRKKRIPKTAGSMALLYNTPPFNFATGEVEDGQNRSPNQRTEKFAVLRLYIGFVKIVNYAYFKVVNDSLIDT
jgi:hypothetical protein